MPTAEFGAKTYHLAIFFRKLHENDRKWTCGGAHPWHPLGPPMIIMIKYAIHNDISVETKKAIFVPNNFFKISFHQQRFGTIR